MQQLPFTLAKKNKLTADVYELIFTIPEKIVVEPGQYTLFMLPKSKLRRAYSIGYTDGQTFTFIIKQLEGGVGSTEICSLEIGEEITGMVPLGHFVLQDTLAPKLFIGTGTGFAPLYFMIRALDAQNMPIKAHFAFGIRTYADQFYFDELAKISGKYMNFQFSIHTSREECAGTFHGYVTDIIDETKMDTFNKSIEDIAHPERFMKYIKQFEEFYLCGSPAMVKDAREKLEKLGIPKEKVFFEQY